MQAWRSREYIKLIVGEVRKTELYSKDENETQGYSKASKYIYLLVFVFIKPPLCDVMYVYASVYTYILDDIFNVR